MSVEVKLQELRLCLKIVTSAKEVLFLLGLMLRAVNMHHFQN